MDTIFILISCAHSVPSPLRNPRRGDPMREQSGLCHSYFHGVQNYSESLICATPRSPCVSFHREAFDHLQDFSPSRAQLSEYRAMLQTLIRRAAETPKPLFDFERNPYKAKRPWPPDFSKLSSKHQFRFERRYKRRAKLKWARPGWTKFTKLAQWGSILGMVHESDFNANKAHFT